MPTLIQTNPPHPAHRARPARPARETLPTMYDLPSEQVGDPGMPDEFHAHQATLLGETFQPPVVPSDEAFSAIDMNLYYDEHHTNWYKRPDWFGVIGIPRFYEGWDSRLSYVVWQEEVSPTIVVELLSPGTEKEDLGYRIHDAAEPPAKWEVYERILRVPYYAVFGRVENDMRIFRLNGPRYEEVIGHGGRHWIEALGLGLGLWQGTYHHHERLWIRWYDARENWVPTSDERAEHAQMQAEHAQMQAEHAQMQAEHAQMQAEHAQMQAEHAQMQAERERLHAEQERLRAENAEQRTARLAEMLRQLGQDPDRL